jgi:anti-sigma factor RsiW
MAGDMPSRPVLGGARCDRVRQWTSLRVDGELSELEGAVLERHLEGCAECRSFELGLRSAVDLLRTAPAEPSSVRFDVPAPASARFPVGRRLAVAAVALAAAVGSLVGSTIDRPAPRPQEPPQVSLLITKDVQQLRQIPRGKHIVPPAPARVPGEPPEGII